MGSIFAPASGPPEGSKVTPTAFGPSAAVQAAASISPASTAVLPGAVTQAMPSESHGIESDDEEAQIRLSYTLSLHLMQVQGTFLRRSKSVGSVTFEAMELFEDEDSVGTHIPNAMGMLNNNALTLVLARIQRTVGFVCSGFEYSGGYVRGSTSSAKIMVSTWAQLDKCLEFVEDTNTAVDVFLVPIVSFLFQDEGEGSSEDFRLDSNANDVTWYYCACVSVRVCVCRALPSVLSLCSYLHTGNG